MSVLKSKRELSQMEFYINARDLRTDVTNYLLKDFGTKTKKYELTVANKNIEDEDKEILKQLAIKYQKTNECFYKYSVPEWFREVERTYVLNTLRNLISNICKANSLYPQSEEEYQIRRNYINEAISDCWYLYQEMDYIYKMFPFNANILVPVLNKINREIELLKGWRKYKPNK